MNRIKTAALLAGLTALLLFAGQALGGRSGFLIALLLAGLTNIASYWWSDKIVLTMHGAKPLEEHRSPELFSLVRSLAAQGGIPAPRLYIVPGAAPNAFATGRNPQNAAVALTEGLLETLNNREVAGVLAHELAHVKNRDTLIMTAAVTLAGALSKLADTALWSSLLGNRSSDSEESHPLAGILGVMVAPLAAALIQMSISRSREFEADAVGARMCGDPLSLASALEKLELQSRRGKSIPGSPATAHMYIVNPFRGGLASLFSTHPSTAERVKRLRVMTAGGVSANVV